MDEQSSKRPCCKSTAELARLALRRALRTDRAEDAERLVAVWRKLLEIPEVR